MIQCRKNCSQGNHAETHIIDMPVETVEMTDRYHPSLELGDQEVPGVELFSPMMMKNQLYSSKSIESLDLLKKH